jgi:hypothetical protein
MIGYNLAACIAIVVVALTVAIFIKRTWLRATFVVLMYAGIFLTVTAGMSELRPRIEQARAQGKSEDFVNGLAARDEQLLQARIEIFIFSTGLVVLALAGLWGPSRGGVRRKP